MSRGPHPDERDSPKRVSNERRKKKDPKTRKTCFVICPIGKPRSKERLHCNKVFTQLIKPAVSTLGYEVYRIDHLGYSGSIPEAIVEQLRDASLVVADLTLLMPNVLWELGIRMAWNLPVILIADDKTTLPFDLFGINTLFFSFENGTATKSAVRSLASRVKKALADTSGKPRTTMFATSMNHLGSSYSLNAVFYAKGRMIDHFCTELRRVRDELVEDFEQRNPKATRPLRYFVPAVQRCFGSLRSKVTAFEEIASAPVVPLNPRNRCEPLLNRIKELQRQGAGLIRTLKDGGASPTKLAFRNVERTIDALVAQAEEIGTDCTPIGT